MPCQYCVAPQASSRVWLKSGRRVRCAHASCPGGEDVKGSDKPKKLQKKAAQKTLKEKRNEKRAAKKSH